MDTARAQELLHVLQRELGNMAYCASKLRRLIDNSTATIHGTNANGIELFADNIRQHRKEFNRVFKPLLDELAKAADDKTRNPYLDA